MTVRELIRELKRQEFQDEEVYIWDKTQMHSTILKQVKLRSDPDPPLVWRVTLESY